MRNSVQYKTDSIHLRVDPAVKNLAREKAEKYFGGNMSMMFRYAVHRCNFEEIEECDENGCDRNMAASTSAVNSMKVMELLKSIYAIFKDLLLHISAIGNNVNQIAHHANAMNLAGKSPLISKSELDMLRAMQSDLHSLRVSLGSHWKNIKAGIETEGDK